MTRLLLVRHARPAATWEESTDSPLDEVGAQQAVAVAERLHARGPLPVATSPLRRARETATPLASRWGVEPRVVEAVGDVPSPPPAKIGDDLEARGVWLRRVLTQRWADVDGALHAWRDRLLEGLTAFDADTAVFTHYVAINTVVGAATGDDRLVCCMPGHASVTEVDVGAGGVLSLVSLGAQESGPQVASPL